MVERIQKMADFSVGRAFGFAMLAILVVGFGLSFQPDRALYAMATLTLVLSLCLLASAWQTGRRAYDKTELWLLLTPDERPDKHVAGIVISTALRAARIKFAIHAAAASAGMFTASLAWSLIAHAR